MLGFNGTVMESWLMTVLLKVSDSGDNKQGKKACKSHYYLKGILALLLISIPYRSTLCETK